MVTQDEKLTPHFDTLQKWFIFFLHKKNMRKGYWHFSVKRKEIHDFSGHSWNWLAKRPVARPNVIPATKNIVWTSTGNPGMSMCLFLYITLILYPMWKKKMILCTFWIFNVLKGAGLICYLPTVPLTTWLMHIILWWFVQQHMHTP